MKPPIPLLAAAALVAPLQALGQGAGGSISVKFAPPPALNSFPAGSVPVPSPQFVSPAAQGQGAIGAFAVPGVPRAGISWQQFNVQGGEVVRFARPAAATVNRVAPESVQQIAGAMQASVRAPAVTAFSDVQLDLKRPTGQISATTAMQTPEGRIVFRATPQ